jgi:exonuclease SbcD
MRFLHISDLHLGKVIHGVSMIENGDQPYWIDKFLALAEELRPEAVLISGDVYDRGSPSGSAVELMSRLVEGLAGLDICVLLAAGNHDSGQQLQFFALKS